MTMIGAFAVIDFLQDLLRGGSGCRLPVSALVLNVSFGFLEGGPDMPGDCSAANFDGHCWRGSLEQSHEHHTEDVVVGMLVIGYLGHVCRQGTDQSVTQENTEKRSHQGRSHFFANL